MSENNFMPFLIGVVQYSLMHDLAHNALTYKTAVCDNGKFCKWVDFDLKWVVSAKLQTIEQQLSWTAFSLKGQTCGDPNLSVATAGN